jgi:hypothetical protein
LEKFSILYDKYTTFVFNMYKIGKKLGDYIQDGWRDRNNTHRQCKSANDGKRPSSIYGIAHRKFLKICFREGALTEAIQAAIESGRRGYDFPNQKEITTQISATKEFGYENNEDEYLKQPTVVLAAG